jgi:hypothetical protein
MRGVPDRVSIRFGRGNGSHAYDSGASRFIYDDNGLTEKFLSLFRYQAYGQVAAPAEKADKGDRALGNLATSSS